MLVPQIVGGLGPSLLAVNVALWHWVLALGTVLTADASVWGWEMLNRSNPNLNKTRLNVNVTITIHFTWSDRCRPRPCTPWRSRGRTRCRPPRSRCCWRRWSPRTVQSGCSTHQTHLRRSRRLCRLGRIENILINVWKVLNVLHKIKSNRISCFILSEKIWESTSSGGQYNIPHRCQVNKKRIRELRRWNNTLVTWTSFYFIETRNYENVSFAEDWKMNLWLCSRAWQFFGKIHKG